MEWSSLPIPESKFSISGFEKGTLGLAPAGMAPAKLNFAEEPKYAPLLGSIPSKVATPGSSVPAGPLAVLVWAPHAGHAVVFGDKKLETSVCPTTRELPRTRLRNAVRW